MVNFDYETLLHDKGKICSALFEICYKIKMPDRRFQNQELSFRKKYNGRNFHLTVSIKSKRLHLQLHKDIQKAGYHKAENSGEDLYKEKKLIVEEFKRNFV